MNEERSEIMGEQGYENMKSRKYDDSSKETKGEHGYDNGKKEKRRRIPAAIYFLLVVMTAVTVSSVSVCAACMNKQKQSDKKVTEMSKQIEQLEQVQSDNKAAASEEEKRISELQQLVAEMSEKNDSKENDVKIAGQYVIRSTENISNAYISGDTSALNDEEKETLDMAKAILDEIIKDGMTDLEKEKAVYDWMTSNLSTGEGITSVIPGTSPNCDNPHGVLKYRKAVCVGYATTFRLFMQMMGIPCKVVHNSDCFHSWALTQIDGHWYHTDIYSDVGVGNYANFNLSDEMMASEQWDRDAFPAADCLDANLIVGDASEIKDATEIPAAIRAILDNKEEQHIVRAFRYKGDDPDGFCVKVGMMMTSLTNNMYNSYEYSSYMVDSRTVMVEGDVILIITIDNMQDYNNEETQDQYQNQDMGITDDDIEEMRNALNAAFSDMFGDMDVSMEIY